MDKAPKAEPSTTRTEQQTSLPRRIAELRRGEEYAVKARRWTAAREAAEERIALQEQLHRALGPNSAELANARFSGAEEENA